MVESHFRKKNQAGYHGGVQFRGILEVTDQDHFTETYYYGIGSAKAFGFGLLLLAPIEI
jgi:CRISPR system Cascade subunit CasE